MKKNIWMGVFLVLAMSCGKETPRDPATERLEAPALATVSEITTTGDRATLVGRRVEFARVQAQDVVGDVAFWIGDPNHAVPAVLGSELRGQGGEGDVSIRKGRFYKITGVVRLVENVDRSDATWALVDDREMEAISAARIYVETATVTPVH